MTLDYTYSLYLQGIERLASDLQGQSFDFIAGFSRGGAIPAVHLSHKLNIPCRILHWSTRDHITKDLSTGLIQELLFSRIILVDDIIDTGKTIIEFYEFMDCTRDHLTIASLVSRSDALVQPDYTHCKDPDGWVDFWWEK